MLHKILQFVVPSVFALGLLSSPVTAAQPTTPDKEIRINTPALSPNVAKRLSVATSRDTLIKTLLANPATKLVVSEAATKAGITPANIGSLAKTPIAKVSPKVVAAAAASIDYAKFDWSAGVFFNPLAPPKYANGTYNLGEYEFNFATLRTGEPNLVRYRLEVPDRNVSQYLIVQLQVELPTGPSTYAIALNLSTPYGSSPTEWLNVKEKCPYLFASLYVGWKRYPIILTPIIGQSGYAGIVSADLQEQPKTPGSQMRAITADIDVFLSLPYDIPEGGDGLATNRHVSLVFGGLTLTRL